MAFGARRSFGPENHVRRQTQRRARPTRQKVRRMRGEGPQEAGGDPGPMRAAEGSSQSKEQEGAREKIANEADRLRTATRRETIGDDGDRFDEDEREDQIDDRAADE